MQGSIVWGNVKSGEASNWADCWYADYTCSTPLPSGEGNVCADPMFVDAANGDFRLRMGSPCINAYTSPYPMLYEYEAPYPYDFDGNPRIQRGTPDIGPYEYQPTNATQTITAPVPVEFAWIDAKCPGLLASVGGDYDKAVLLSSANPIDTALPEPLRTYYSLWESYVADLDPTDSNATFRATISIANGVPSVKGDPESPNRKYTVLGKQSLTDEVWSASCPAPQFFKVRVELK